MKAVVFDVGETLLDETGVWERAADAAGVPRLTVMGILGGLAERGEHHQRVWEILGVERPAMTFEPDELYPDALPCLDALRARGVAVGVVGPQPVVELLRDRVDLAGSAETWGVGKPAPEFFRRIVAEAALAPREIAHVGDRVDYDVEPALAAGMVSVHVRRGPWGYLGATPPGAIRVDALAELPEALGV